MVLVMGAASAQNKFRGIVKYKLTSTGKVDMSIPADQSTMEIKVFDDRLFTGQTVQRGMNVTQAIDFSQALAYLSYNDVQLESYEGDGKFLISDNANKSSIDSLYIEDKEPEHFYYEMGNGTRDFFGFTAKELIMHRYDVEGNDNPMTCWYTTEIGPEYTLLPNMTMKGFPLVITQDLGEGRAITLTCSEIVKGKVKEIDFVLPDGYKDATPEEFAEFYKELMDAASLLEN